MRQRIVPFRVQPDKVNEFKSITLAHVSESLKEPGISRFEFLKQEQDPTRFVLLISFKDDAAREHHFALSHTHRWRAAVIPLLLDPIQPVQYEDVSIESKEN